MSKIIVVGLVLIAVAVFLDYGPVKFDIGIWNELIGFGGAACLVKGGYDKLYHRTKKTP